MNKKESLYNILTIFDKINPNPRTELMYKDEYQLTVAVILSAQCTDKRVNIITKNFFKKFPDFKTLSSATIDEIFELIKSCSYPNNKAKYLKSLADELVDKYNGILPDNYEKLLTLSGIGPKTAKVILNVLYDAPTIPVDTHVKRVATRLGFAKEKDTPLKIEKILLELAPSEYVNRIHHWFILHGRYVCTAKSPKCINCPISKYCDYFIKNFS
ncbi:MAG: Ultraviolet N-glycosylase/AP lyase [Bacteroidetes bacterium ADurb.Bin035]|nr:MAG: Ultraviolet N-glycosylase/AP lyase [Bacteroidetes bacterium ADurb.Bin035]HOC40832.1 endonuclease III [Bacteroidales bacterium]HQM78576.1 endonuclease III [Bacteroidales bacterium]